MFAEVMLVQQMLFDRRSVRVKLQGFQGHFGDDFQGHSVFDCFLAAWPPHERRVSMDQHGGNCGWIKLFEPLHDYISSLPFVRRSNFLRGHRPGDWNFSIKIIGVRSAETWNAPPGLSKCNGVARMGMNDRTYPCKCLEQSPVRRCI